jgi:outer membrane protein OmpA-like peptidoglycan-associated protein
MSITHIRALILWAAILAVAILSLTGATLSVRIGALTGVVLVAVGLWGLAARRRPERAEWSTPDSIATLPPVSYRKPVVLVCGEGQADLFGSRSSGEVMLRVTGQGCYISVPKVDRLPSIVSGLLAIRPDWRGQLSVMFVVMPQAHSEGGALAGQIRALCHQINVVRRRAIKLPMVLVSYLQVPCHEDAWFCWDAAQPASDVHQAGGSVSLAQWQRETAEAAKQPHRLQVVIELNGIVAWLDDTVMAHFAAHGRDRAEVPVACAVFIGPMTARQAPDNLWARWLRERVGVESVRQLPAAQVEPLPFPDCLLNVLPRHTGSTAIERACVIAIWMFAAAGMAALLNAASQNALLLRQVTDDLRRYASVVAASGRTDAQFSRQESALEVLHQDAQRLDTYYRQGQPLALGFGLYRGENLRRPLWQAIADHRPAPTALAAQSPLSVRLDSLSLFNTGSADLRTNATKVLIEALVNIKARSNRLIVITGHTDASGSTAHNLHLSRARAEAVRDWMQRMGGLADNCFAVRGAGASQPVARNDTEQGRSANRRVDIRLVPEDGACALAPAPDKELLSHPATLED